MTEVQFSAVSPDSTRRISSFFWLVISLDRWEVKYQANPDTTEARMKALGPRLDAPRAKYLAPYVVIYLIKKYQTNHS